MPESAFGHAARPNAPLVLNAPLVSKTLLTLETLLAPNARLVLETRRSAAVSGRSPGERGRRLQHVGEGAGVVEGADDGENLRAGEDFRGDGPDVVVRDHVDRGEHVVNRF